MGPLPPGRLTTPAAFRLRLAAAFASACLVVAAAGGPAGAVHHTPVKVLVGTSVSAGAQGTMAAALWSQLVRAYVNADTVAFAGAPSVDDCRRAKATYAVSAPFELRPRLPGSMNSDGRVAGMTHLVVTNCVSSDIVYDRVIWLDSDPPGSATAGDFESVPEISWSRAIPAELAKYPVFFRRLARVIQVTPPFAYIDDLEHVLAVGDAVRVYASANGKPRAQVILTVTRVGEKRDETIYPTLDGNPAPQVGDFVEPVPKGSGEP